MSTDTLNQVGKLLKENRFDEAKELVRNILSLPLSEQEKTKVYVDYTFAYMQVMNALNDRYEQALKEAIEDIETLEQEKVKLENKLQVAKVMMSGR